MLNRASAREELRQRWPNSRSRPLFGLYENLFAASVLSIDLSDSIFGSTYLCEEICSQMKTNQDTKAVYPMYILNTAFIYF